MTIVDVALYTHLISLGISLSGIVLADHEGFRWIRGRVQTLNGEILHMLHNTVNVGIGAMVGSGSVLFWQSKEYLLTDTVFYVKMTFVIALLINSFFIKKYLSIATTQSFASLTSIQKRPLYISGAVSTISWVGAFITAFFLF